MEENSPSEKLDLDDGVKHLDPSVSTNGTLFDGYVLISSTTPIMQNRKTRFSLIRSLELRRFAGCLLIIIMTLGLIGNTLTVAAVFNYPKIRKYPVAFILR